MKETWLKLIPAAIVQQAVDLEPTGVNNLAWRRSEALIVTRLLFEQAYAILGGDVLVIVRGEPTMTYDNWYIPRQIPEISWDEFVVRGRELTEHYLKSYNEGDKLTLYTLTIASSNDYQLLKGRQRAK